MEERQKNKVSALGQFWAIPKVIMEMTVLSLQSRIIYGVIWTRHNGNNVAWPSQKYMAKCLGIGERSVRRYIKELEDHCLIECIRRGLQRSNRYRILTLPQEVERLCDEFEMMKDVMMQVIRQRDGYRCRSCSEVRQRGEYMELVHDIPIRYGGTNEPENIVLLCGQCMDEYVDNGVDIPSIKSLRGQIGRSGQDISGRSYNICIKRPNYNNNNINSNSLFMRKNVDKSHKTGKLEQIGDIMSGGGLYG